MFSMTFWSLWGSSQVKYFFIPVKGKRGCHTSITKKERKKYKFIKASKLRARNNIGLRIPQALFKYIYGSNGNTHIWLSYKTSIGTNISLFLSYPFTAIPSTIDSLPPPPPMHTTTQPPSLFPPPPPPPPPPPLRPLPTNSPHTQTLITRKILNVTSILW